MTRILGSLHLGHRIQRLDFRGVPIHLAVGTNQLGLLSRVQRLGDRHPAGTGLIRLITIVAGLHSFDHSEIHAIDMQVQGDGFGFISGVRKAVHVKAQCVAVELHIRKARRQAVLVGLHSWMRFEICHETVKVHETSIDVSCALLEDGEVVSAGQQEGVTGHFISGIVGDLLAIDREIEHMPSRHRHTVDGFLIGGVLVAHIIGYAQPKHRTLRAGRLPLLFEQRHQLLAGQGDHCVGVAEGQHIAGFLIRDDLVVVRIQIVAQATCVDNADIRGSIA